MGETKRGKEQNQLFELDLRKTKLVYAIDKMTAFGAVLPFYAYNKCAQVKNTSYCCGGITGAAAGNNIVDRASSDETSESVDISGKSGGCSNIGKISVLDRELNAGCVPENPTSRPRVELGKTNGQGHINGKNCRKNNDIICTGNAASMGKNKSSNNGNSS